MKRVFEFVWALVILAGVSTTTVSGAPYDTWLNAKFTASELSNLSVSGATADPDGDGIPNLMEYGLGLEPKTRNPHSVRPVNTIQGGYLTIQFTQDSSLTDINYIVEYTTDMQTWQTSSSYVVLSSSVPLQGTQSRVTYRAVSPVSAQSKQFLRLRVTTSPNLPESWQLSYFGQIGMNPSALAPNGSGKTILECYQQGLDPRQTAPAEPYSITVAATGPYQSPANVNAVASVVYPSTSTISQVSFAIVGTTYAGTVTQPPYQYQFTNLTPGTYYVQATAIDQSGKTVSASSPFQVVENNRYVRVKGYSDPILQSSVIAIDFQRGVSLDEITDFTTLYPTSKYPYFPWFLRTKAEANEPWYHLDLYVTGTGPESGPYVHQCSKNATVNGIPVGGVAPMVAFGSQGGGTPLYVNQSYNFGVAAGGRLLEATTSADIMVAVYQKSDFANGLGNVPPVLTKTYTLPRESNAADWADFTQNGFVRQLSINDTYNGKTVSFSTQLQFTWGGASAGWGQLGNYVMLISHKAGNSDFYYKVSYMGWTQPTGSPYIYGLTYDSLYNVAYNLTYTLDFEDASPFQTTFINQPQFQGTPLPSAYQGKSLDELIHGAPAVADTLPVPGSTGLNLSSVDNSPELKSHPVLDKFLASMGSDPMALANYVLNEIELTDAVGYNMSTGGITDKSINAQGVSRDALAVYLEGQGSPTEQCALLIYLLRKSGVPCGYVFPPQNSMLMFDQQMSKLLRMQLRGAANTEITSSTYNVPALIPVNYPWVAAYINNKWVHIYPWLKDTAVEEGYDVWKYLPNGFQTGKQWTNKYFLNDTTIRSLSTEDNPGTLFPLYIQKQLSGTGLSLDQMGVKCYNRRNYYTRWEDFPRPWTTPTATNSNLAQNLDASQNPNQATALNNIFDTVTIQVASDRNQNGQVDSGELLFNTGTMRLVDLHDRRLLLYHQVIQGSTPTRYNLILSLEPYSASYSGQYTFNGGTNADPGSLLNGQMVTTTLSTTTDSSNDDLLIYNVTINRHRQATSVSNTDMWTPFLGLYEKTTISKTNNLRKGEMACLCLNYGQVSEKMMEYQAEKYWSYQNTLSASSTAAADPEKGQGQLLFIMGNSYYNKLSDSMQTLGGLLKLQTVSHFAQGMASLEPQRNPVDDTPQLVTTTVSGTARSDLNLCYPKVDMIYDRTAYAGNSTVHLNSGDINGSMAPNAIALIGAEISSQEHRVINQYFQQATAISTVRLLDIAQGWTPSTGVASHPGTGIVTLTYGNYISQGSVSYTFTKSSGVTVSQPLSTWAGGTQSGSIWAQITSALTNSNPSAQFTTIYVTPGPVKAPGQGETPYVGMGAMIVAANAATSPITKNISTLNGGIGAYLGYSLYGFYSTQSLMSNLLLTPLFDNSFSLFNAGNFSIGSPGFAPSQFSDSNFGNVNSGISGSTLLLGSDQLGTLNSWQKLITIGNITILDPTGTTTAQANSTLFSMGNTSAPVYYGGLLGGTGLGDGYSLFSGLAQAAADPVNVITGEFYIDAVDIRLNGPMPLEVRRTYGSQNLSSNNFGSGWKMSFFPYMLVSTDSATLPTLIYAAEMDGSVIAYRRQTSPATRWIPVASDNPTLSNVNGGSVGGVTNLFNNRIDQTTSGSDTFYTLVGADGSVRIFKVQSFPTSGAGSVTRTRPYLQSWRDNRGNSCTFSFGTDSTATDYGEVNRVQSSNGNFIGFIYDTYGHVLEAYTGDGRHLYYKYDSNGDLTQVTFPDASSIKYDYQHASTTSGTVTSTYSTHLLTQETKPGGRILQNVYESANNYASRRVQTQSATQNTNSSLIASATFSYTVTGTNSDNTLNGSTSVTDAKGNLTTYTFSGNQLTAVNTPPQNGGTTRQTISQTWYTSTASGGFPRSLASVTDKRGLVTSYKYDSNGNLVQLTRTGNLTGSGNTSELATTTMSYNTATITLSGISMVPNTIASVTDAVGNSTVYGYGDSARPFLTTTISKVASGTTVSTTVRQYTDSTGSGASAYGLLSRETVAANSADQAVTDFTWNNNGFPISKTQYTGTSDPNVTTSYSYNLRGELSSQTDAAGRVTRFAYDSRGNRTGEERYDEWNNLVSWNYAYFNQNGEIEWEQGARYSPNDYVYTQYDGAGRVSQKIKWLSAALSDGSGLTANGYATTLYKYDKVSNLTEVDDANQNATTMSYDSVGEILDRKVRSGSASGTVISTESFTYEPGGQIATHTDILGGTETRTYTSLGQLQSSLMPDGTVKSYLYDLSGRVVRETLSNESYWTTTYSDAVRKITRTFYAKGGGQLAQESQSFDRRGNVISKTDASTNTFVTTFDGLNRVKGVTGPSASGNSAQQSSYHIYDAAGVKHIASNGAGERTNSYLDALGRPTLVSVFNRDGTTASNTGYWYSPDHNSVVTTVGSGSNAVTTTAYTDTMGHTVLLKHGDGSYQVTQFDPVGNKTSFTGEAVNGVAPVTTWTYDPLNRLVTTTLPASSITNSAIVTNTYTFSSTAASALTVAHAMPGGIISKTVYDSAGRKALEKLVDAGNNTTRTFTYSYYTTGTYNGLLSSVLDPRGITFTTTYDSWMRPVSVISSGSATPEQNQITAYAYDNRGMVNTVTQSYALPSTGLGTVVTRGFDAYGKISTETVLTTTATNSTTVSQWAQTWNTAGRRSALSWQPTTATGSQYAYSYNANGQLTTLTNSGSTYSYTYGDSGLLQTRTTPDYSLAVTLRDSLGRIRTQNTTVSSATPLAETLTWRSDSRIDGYTALRGSLASIPNETRTYSYNLRGQLLSEPYRWSGQGFTSSYQFDNNTESGAGLRTLAQTNTTNQSSYQGTTTASNFLRPSSETWKPGDGNTNTVGWGYDSIGCVTTRTLSTGITQTMTWDSLGRLVKVAQRDSSNNGFDFKSVFDGLGRRIQTTQQPITGGANSGTVFTTASTYDPMVEFLELGVNVNGAKTWKVYGAGVNGAYGSMQGLNALEALVTESSGNRIGTLNDYFGNIVATVSSGSVTWSGNTVGSYGVLPGSTAVALDATHGLAQALGFRGHYQDATGFYRIGKRDYDPLSARWMSPDSLGHASSMTLYDAFNGDGVNNFDPTGRCANKVANYNLFGAEQVINGQTVPMNLNNLWSGSWQTASETFGDTGTYLKDTAGGLLAQAWGQFTDPIGTGWQTAQSLYGSATKLANDLYHPYRLLDYEAPSPGTLLGMGLVFIATDGLGGKVLSTTEKLAETTKISTKLYHYTSVDNVAGILEKGLVPGASGKVFTTTTAELTPLQAQIELALSPNRALPNAILEIDAQALQQAGRNPVLGPVRVQPTPNAPGGGWEVLFDKTIPPEFIRQVK